MNNKSIVFAIMVFFILFVTACSPSMSNDKLERQWELVSYGTSASQTPTSGDGNKILLFENGKLSGSAGCNYISGSYSVNGQNITFEPIASTMMACQEPVMQQESTVLSAFSGSATYVIETGIMTITKRDIMIVLKSYQK